MGAISNCHFIQPILIACSLATGPFFGLVEEGLLNLSGWAEALIRSRYGNSTNSCYRNIHRVGQTKTREEAYSTTKLYFSILVLIESTTIRIPNLLFNLIPEGGMLVPSDSQAKSYLEKEIEKKLRIETLHAQSLTSVNSELDFFGGYP